MIKRMWWFAVGATFGGLVMVRALKRRPSSETLKLAAAATGADILDLAARVVRPAVRR